MLRISTNSNEKMTFYTIFLKFSVIISYHIIGAVCLVDPVSVLRILSLMDSPLGADDLQASLILLKYHGVILMSCGLLLFDCTFSNKTLFLLGVLVFFTVVSDYYVSLDHFYCSSLPILQVILTLPLLGICFSEVLSANTERAKKNNYEGGKENHTFELVTGIFSIFVGCWSRLCPIPMLQLLFFDVQNVDFVITPDIMRYFSMSLVIHGVLTTTCSLKDGSKFGFGICFILWSILDYYSFSPKRIPLHRTDDGGKRYFCIFAICIAMIMFSFCFRRIATPSKFKKEQEGPSQNLREDFSDYIIHQKPDNEICLKFEQANEQQATMAKKNGEPVVNPLEFHIHGVAKKGSGVLRKRRKNS
mmetsp:Transcript_24693/g.30838  ORF Transcript_24693/g.30838 Transcript_24693/m.30838 type:complete len:360 (-) Transcript_24693:64-1143(-)